MDAQVQQFPLLVCLPREPRIYSSLFFDPDRRIRSNLKHVACHKETDRDKYNVSKCFNVASGYGPDWPDGFARHLARHAPSRSLPSLRGALSY